jgi:hypothetical protein
MRIPSHLSIHKPKLLSVDENINEKRVKENREKVKAFVKKYHLDEKKWVAEIDGKYYKIIDWDIPPFFKISDTPINIKLLKKIFKDPDLKDCDNIKEYLEKSKVIIFKPGISFKEFKCKKCGAKALKTQSHQEICPTCYMEKREKKKTRFCKCGCGKIISASAHAKKEFYFKACQVNHWRKTHKKIKLPSSFE